MPAVWLIRHAPAAGNVAGAFMGRLDGEPEADGLTRAATLAGTIQATHVLSSPLRRAALTAEAIFPGRAITHDARLAERHFGDWQGRAKADVRAERPDAFTASGTLDLRVTPPGGESLDALLQRVHAVLAELTRRDPEDRIALVAHNAVLRSARILLGLLSIDAASVTPEPFAQPSLVQVDATTLQTVAVAVADADAVAATGAANAGSA